MNIAAQNPTHDAGQAVPVLLELGPQGVAVLLAVAVLALTWKSKTVRKAEWRAFRWACRATWRLLVALVALAVNLVRQRQALTASKEERRLLARLQPGHWREHAEHRGLDGTLTSRPKLTDAGISVALRLTGKWTVKKLQEQEESVRALLGCRTALRLEIRPGKRGGWAELTLRTRSAVDEADMRWTPKRQGIGLDTHTGKPVVIPVGRLLLAGSSGAGKSVTLRPFLAGLCADEKSAVVMVDLKRVEGALWKTRARVARTPDEVAAVAGELQAEMMDRLEALETTGRASWTPTVDRPRLVVVVDEGGEVSAVAKESIAAFESLARMGRAAEIHVVWCTQKPTMSGASAGIPPQIAAQMDVRLCLKVATATEVRTVLGEDATAEGWDAHRLPKPGVLLVRGTGRGPAPVKVWFMDDDTTRNLPPAPVWHGKARDDDRQEQPLLVKETPAPRQDAAARVLRLVQHDGPARQKDIAERAGLPKGTVSKAVARLLAAGQLARLDDGTLAAAE
ncbi:MarR family transcriptional regulator [Streptomyces sp. NPDC057794]|uniref:MarR family transcriptional regulator n=1 Tax=Streptomyces sp. NPDC057794 TaxID=3346251 RepID=UPI00367C0CEA